MFKHGEASFIDPTRIFATHTKRTTTAGRSTAPRVTASLSCITKGGAFEWRTRALIPARNMPSIAAIIVYHTVRGAVIMTPKKGV